MHYKVKGLLIKTENAAKPAAQSSSYLAALLSKMKHVKSAVDWGCGKLRYSIHLKRICRDLTLVDSEIQISRQQIIHGELCNIREYVRRNISNTRVSSLEKFDDNREHFDFALCSNVLSVIPSPIVRNHTIKTLHKILKPNGRCLFTNQYRNSYFKDVMESAESHPFFDGWIRSSLRGPAYYGILRPEKLRFIVEREGFVIEDHKLHDGSNYLFALAVSK